jgi:hypothetical protein
MRSAPLHKRSSGVMMARGRLSSNLRFKFPNATRPSDEFARAHLDDYIGHYRFYQNGPKGDVYYARQGDKLYERDESYCCNVIEPARGRPQFPPCIFARFIFLGIGFQFFVGDDINKFYINHCLVHSDLITRTMNLDAGMAFLWNKIAKGRVLP